MGQRAITQNTLFYGDNLKILRDYVADESVDLIYLDPPFNSNRDYNVLFKDESGIESEAQITAFEDTWHWSEYPYEEVKTYAPEKLTQLLETFVQILGRNQMTAYLVMMSLRLVELHRVLKPTGSLYLHCDPRASHYLKLILDMTFKPQHFLSEVIWKRTYAHGSSRRYGPVHDVILFYTKSDHFVWTNPIEKHDEAYLEKHFTQVDPQTGKQFQPISLTGSGIRHGESGQPWRHVDPTKVNRHWALPGKILEELGITEGTIQDKLEALDRANMIFWPQKVNGVPRLKWYAERLEGQALADIWTDINPISAQMKERLGYPTQKPLILLERILQASSREGDVVLDPFCGCGTTIHAAQKLNRTWIGIDVTHLAIALIKNRLKDAFELEKNHGYQIIGEPEDVQGAIHLAQSVDRYQFQWWAISLISARPYGGEAGSKRGKKGADSGIDGIITFNDDPRSPTKRIIVQVKSGKVSVRDLRELRGTVEREKHAVMGVFLTLQKPSEPMKIEAESCGFYHSPTWHKDYPKMQILTIEQLLNGEGVKMPPTVTTYKKAQKEQLQQIEQEQLL